MRAFHLGLMGILLVSEARSTPASSEKNIWGSRFIAFADSKATLDELQKSVDTQVKRLSEALDPDCLYRPLITERCAPPKNSKEAANFENSIENLNLETKQALSFKIELKGKVFKDYGAIGQGIFLEELQKTKPSGDWMANFSGDVYVSPQYSGDATYSISDPLLPTHMSFATLNLKGGGWALVSGGAALGTPLRDSKGAPLERTDYRQVVLVALPTFSGARLDAWATALMVGGKKTLRHLENLSQYKGQWAYLLFTSQGKVVCSTNLKCDFKDPLNRRVAFLGKGEVNL